MSELLLIGDIHGKWERYSQILEMKAPERSVQLGDFGWGFPPIVSDRSVAINDAMTKLPGDHRYFRGNHDNPTACLLHEFCLDDLHWEPDTGIMVIAGAASIDKEWRTPGVTWWEDEELSYQQLDEAINLYEERKPRIVLSHDAPEDVVPYIFPRYRQEFRSRTRDALGSMFYIHQPELWVFGHWHVSQSYHAKGTKFVCLNELETMVVDV